MLDRGSIGCDILSDLPELLLVLLLFNVGAIAGPVNRMTLVKGPNNARLDKSTDLSPCSCPKWYAEAVAVFASMYFRT